MCCKDTNLFLYDQIKTKKILFCIKIVCFRVIYILIRCKTRNRQTHPDRFKPWRWAHPRPDLSSLTPWATTHRTKSRAHTLDRFRASDGNAIAPSGMPHALSRAPSVPSREPSPARVCVRIYLQVSPYLHHTNGLQGGGCIFLLEVCSKYQFALTVRNIPCFLGFDLRIAAFGEIGF